MIFLIALYALAATDSSIFNYSPPAISITPQCRIITWSPLHGHYCSTFDLPRPHRSRARAYPYSPPYIASFDPAAHQLRPSIPCPSVSFSLQIHSTHLSSIVLYLRVRLHTSAPPTLSTPFYAFEHILTLQRTSCMTPSSTTSVIAPYPDTLFDLSARSWVPA